jgi:hypothetical protein
MPEKDHAEGVNVMESRRVDLTEKQAQSIRRKARTEGRSEAEVIPDLLDEALSGGLGRESKTVDDPLDDLAGSGKEVSAQEEDYLSTNVKEYLYGSRE